MNLEEGINVLSLFDGISAGQVALERAGIKVNNYFAAEIDKNAIQVTMKNYPNTIQLGDVFEIDYSKLPKIDIVIGGSPCTYWSIAKNDRETTSDGEGFKLFMQFVRAIRETKSEFFLYENNYSIHQDIKDAITKELGVVGVMINSALVTAQNRKRVYWTNISEVIRQPEDRKIFLKDVLVGGYECKFDRINGIRKNDNGKSLTICASDWRGLNRNQQQNGVLIPIGDYVKSKYENFVETNGRVPELFNPYNSSELSDKSPTLTTQCGSMTSSASVCVAMRGRYNEYGKTEQQLEPRNDGKTNTLTTVTKDNLIAEPADHPIRIGDIGSKSQAHRVYSVKGKSVNLTANGGGQGAKTGLYKIDLPDGEYIIRKLEPVECERLQSFDDGYTEGISNNQRYRCLGNSWTVDVIVHILSHIFNPIKKESMLDLWD